MILEVISNLNDSMMLQFSPQLGLQHESCSTAQHKSTNPAGSDKIDVHP